MRRWLSLSSYHVVVLILLISMFSVLFAWNSYGLITIAMANVGFLKTHGLMAIAEGGLLQLFLIGVKAFVALLSYLGFKGVEVELIFRWRNLGAAAAGKAAKPDPETGPE